MNKFFGFSVEAPWPEEFPPGKILPPESRHLTVYFLGEKEFEGEMPKPPFSLSPAGVITDLLFLRSVVAYSPVLFGPEVEQFASTFPQDKKWLPHITISRTPNQEDLWKQSFSPFPFFLKEFCLYQTVVPQVYEKLKSFPLIPPFEEVAHTADIAFHVRGRDHGELYRHAALALAFRAPTLAQWVGEEGLPNLVEVVAALNELLFRLDIEEGSPIKAVSHAGHIEDKGAYLEWEMIVDV